MKRIITLLLIAAFVLGVVGQSAADPVLFLHKFKAGAIDKYRLKMDFAIDMNLNGGSDAMGMNFNIPNLNMRMQMVMTQKTLKVLPDGAGVVKVTIRIEEMSIPGMPKGVKKQIPPAQSMTMTMAPDGRVLKINELAGMMKETGMPPIDFSQFLGQIGCNGSFPTETVNVGDVWEQSIPMPFGGGQMNVVSTLASTNEQVWSLKAAKVAQNYQGYIDLGEMMKGLFSAVPMDAKTRREMASIAGGMDLTGTTQFLFSPEKGKLLKANGDLTANLKLNLPAQTAKSAAPPTMDMAMAMNFTMSRFN